MRTLEAEIDKIVYRLYGLMPEEIAIVEGATANVLASGGKTVDLKKRNPSLL